MNRCWIVTGWIAISLNCAWWCNAQTRVEPVDVNEAHQLYEAGRLNEAVSAYKQLIAMGIENGWLHYDLGNALFRQGKLGESILEYERALKYLPRFDDLRHNLDYARSLIVDEELRPTVSQGAVGFLINLHQALNLRESLILFVVLWWLLAMVIALGWIMRWRDRLSILRRVLYVLVLVGLVSTALTVVESETTHYGVVLVPAIEVKTGPGDDYSVTFELHEGTTVRLDEARGGWVRIRLPNGLLGWMPIESLGVV